MWQVAVVIVNEDTENALKVAAGDDQEPIEALSASGADEALGDRVGLRRAYRCLDTSMPSLAKMASKSRLNSLSRSRLRKRSGGGRAAIVQANWRACWATQGAVTTPHTVRHLTKPPTNPGRITPPFSSLAMRTAPLHAQACAHTLDQSHCLYHG